MSSMETQQLGNIIDAATGDHERGFFLWHEGTGLKNNDVMTCAVMDCTHSPIKDLSYALLRFAFLQHDASGTGMSKHVTAYGFDHRALYAH